MPPDNLTRYYKQVLPRLRRPFGWCYKAGVMEIGAIFPLNEIGNDPAVIKDYAQAAEALGYDYILAFDHVLGANPASHTLYRTPMPPTIGAETEPYGYTHAFHEIFVLLGFLAAATERIGFMTGVVILPQRQTALVAKQAAALDVLSGGRLRLGIGVGWNQVEYEALGENFTNRGRRSEEQIEVMRALWTQELVTFEGEWHSITDAGLNPLPVQKPIPIWIGGYAAPVLRRIGAVSDGWVFAAGGSPATRRRRSMETMIETVHDHAREAGRDPADIGLEAMVGFADRGPDGCAETIAGWKDRGASHASIDTMGAELETPDDHIDAIRRAKEAIGNA